MLDRAHAQGPVPLPGTRAWARLADDDPRKLAAVIFAALFWCDQHTPEALAERAEFDAYEDRRTLREASWAIAETMRLGRGEPSYVDLQRRRMLASDLLCGAPGCREVVRVAHPLPDDLAVRLPDTSWARCSGHAQVPVDGAA